MDCKGSALEETVRRLTSEKEVTGSLGELTPLYECAGLAAAAVLLVGLGPRSRFDSGAAFSAGFALSKRLAGKRRESVAIALPRAEDPQDVASALIEGAIVGTRGPGLRKTEANRHAFGFAEPDRRPSQTDDRLALERTLVRGEVVGQRSTWRDDLVNTRRGEKSPAELAERISWSPMTPGSPSMSGMKPGSARSGSAACSAWRRARTSLRPSSSSITSMGVIRPRSPLVGKGVTFDSGGLSLKPSAHRWKT